MLSSASIAAAAQSNCRAEWTVTTSRIEHSLNVTLTEIGARGAACDLVVKNLTYLDGAGVLALDVAPARFCPLDAIAERTAKLTWQLPQELRATGALRLVVNGSDVGVLSFRSSDVAFKGGCQ